MPQVNVASENPLNKIESLAIVIGNKGRHIGMFFRPVGEDLQMIHLGWHDDFRCGEPDLCWHDDSRSREPDKDFCWIPCEGINSIVLANIADWLAVVWKENGESIPYSIKPFDADPFDDSGKLRFREQGDGFTCATFVLWVFSHSQIELVNKDSWEDRDEDRCWRAWIVEMLEEHSNADKAHIDAQREYINTASRFRPVEVAGAAGDYAGTPIEFTHATLLGECVKQRMELHGML